MKSQPLAVGYKTCCLSNCLVDVEVRQSVEMHVQVLETGAMGVGKKSRWEGGERGGGFGKRWEVARVGGWVPRPWCLSISVFLSARLSIRFHPKNIRFVLCFAAEVFAYDNLSIRFSTPFVTISVGFV